MPYHYSEVTRFAVITHRRCGLSWAAICKKVHELKSRAAAVKIWNSRNPRLFRPMGPNRVITEEIASRIDEALLDDPWSTAPELRSRLRLKASTSSIQRYRAANYKAVKGAGCPILSALNQKKRQNWCRYHINDTWDDVIFTDEKSFFLYNNTRAAWIKPGCELPFRSQPSHVPRVQVLGAISCRGPIGVVFFVGHLNSEMHKQHLDLLVPQIPQRYPGSFRYLQDNDSSHTAHDSKIHLKRAVPRVQKLPPQSPDLNPIEHLWAALDTRVARHNATTVAQLQEAVRQEWLRITVQECNSLIDNLHTVTAAVYHANGRHVTSRERRRYGI
jgi:hypothetical protein